ncbi:hypothetical protein NMP99_05000 [Glutamicibacter mishrai]|uniref:hypothetical protein n=1 Tax=Glutamicibacter mishrai TaxID=1775880 RepID=UPI0020CF0B72|nr:hypothetical protein [Glutamicibacter mishrai]UTT40647.1 hypothetical protein NMP99_05000 [Glutamicibacter mishrai]
MIDAMRWIDKWFDESDWTRDPELDIFRDSVWELTLDGQVRGWLTTSVSIMRSFPFLWEKQECLWWQTHWADGQHDLVEEDYGPGWYTVIELRDGYVLVDDPKTQAEARFEANPMTGAERARLWKKLDHGSNG